MHPRLITEYMKENLRLIEVEGDGGVMVIVQEEFTDLVGTAEMVMSAKRGLINFVRTKSKINGMGLK